jgi:hypothetical protein
MLLGAALVCVGILGTALAERISRRADDRDRDESDERAPARETTRPRTKSTPAPVIDLVPGSDDVIAALVGAGFKKALATQAALACTDREQATAESWMTAALRRCAQGGAS